MSTSKSVYDAKRRTYTLEQFTKALPIKDYAEKYNYSISAVRKQINRGKIKAFKFAGKLLCF